MTGHVGFFAMDAGELPGDFIHGNTSTKRKAYKPSDCFVLRALAASGTCAHNKNLERFVVKV
jgi:hypothetical protein